MSNYRSFKQLAAREIEGVDYRIRRRLGASGTSVVAIHGGGIEPGTTEIAEAVSGLRHGFYTFSGIKPHGNAALHITSRLFDEPLVNGLAAEAAVILSIHGCGDSEPVVFYGGLFHQLAEGIGKRLVSAGFTARKSNRYPGINPHNICNRGRLGKGVQIEVSAGLRRIFFGDLRRMPLKVLSPLAGRFTHAIASALENVPGE